MKVLFIGDYSNYHACLAAELRNRGICVTLVSDGGAYMNTDCDIKICRGPGLQGSIQYLRDVYNISRELKGYDIVQLISPGFVHLRPEKLKFFLNRFKSNNGSLFLTLAGDDYFFVKACEEGKIFKYSEYKVGDKLTEFGRTATFTEWLKKDLRKYTEFFYNNLDGAMSALPEYDMAAKPILGGKLTYTGIPIDLSLLKYEQLDITAEKLNLFLGMKEESAVRKGTNYLYKILKELEEEMPDRCRVIRVSNKSIKEYYELMKTAHIVIDQLYSYSPATNALAAMALGKVAATGAMPEYYDYLSDDFDKPIIGLSPLDPDIKSTLKDCIINRGKLVYMSIKGRKLVEKNNDVTIVADRYIEHWNKMTENNFML